MSFIPLDFEIVGMEGVDKEKVQRVVYEMSKGSQYFKNEERKEAFIKEKIENMRSRCAKLTAADLSHYQKVRSMPCNSFCDAFSGKIGISFYSKVVVL